MADLIKLGPITLGDHVQLDREALGFRAKQLVDLLNSHRPDAGIGSKRDITISWLRHLENNRLTRPVSPAVREWIAAVIKKDKSAYLHLPMQAPKAMASSLEQPILASSTMAEAKWSPSVEKVAKTVLEIPDETVIWVDHPSEGPAASREAESLAIWYAAFSWKRASAYVYCNEPPAVVGQCGAETLRMLGLLLAVDVLMKISQKGTTREQLLTGSDDDTRRRVYLATCQEVFRGIDRGEQQTFEVSNATWEEMQKRILVFQCKKPLDATIERLNPLTWILAKGTKPATFETFRVALLLCGYGYCAPWDIAKVEEYFTRRRPSAKRTKIEFTHVADSLTSHKITLNKITLSPPKE